MRNRWGLVLVSRPPLVPTDMCLPWAGPGPVALEFLSGTSRRPQKGNSQSVQECVLVLLSSCCLGIHSFIHSFIHSENACVKATLF